MGRVTINRINQALLDADIQAEICRGEGYFYFMGSAMDYTQEQGVYGVWNLGELTVEEWVEEARKKMKK